MPTSQLEAHPQLLLACLAALSTSSVHVYGILLKLLCKVRLWSCLSSPLWLALSCLQY